jgi:integrase
MPGKLPRNLELRGGVYYVRVMINGRRQRVSTGHTTLRSAIRRADEIKVQLRNDRDFGKGEAPFFADWVKEYLEVYSSRKRGGAANDTSTLANARTYFGRYRLDEVTPTVAQRYLNMRSETRANATVNLERAVLGAVYSKAVQDGLVEVNPWKKTRKLPTEPRMRVLSLEDEDRLRAILSPKYQRWLTFMLGTGLRLAEARTITLDRIDEEKELIFVPEEGAKGGKARAVPLRPEVLRVLKVQEAEEGGLWHGTPQTYQDMLRHYAKKAGIPHVSPHDLRHTFATRYLKGGGNIFTLSKILGHASVAITEKTYVHLVPTDIVEMSRHVDLGLTA